MDNRKRILFESSQSAETGKRFRREPDLENLAGKQEPVGLGMTASKRRTSRVDSRGDK